MPSGQKTSEELSLVVSRMLAANMDLVNIMALTGISKRQIQRIQARLRANNGIYLAGEVLQRGRRPRMLTFEDIEVCDC